MNKKEEIEYKIKVHEFIITDSTEAIVSLRADLAESESEKPKLRHGDWWYTRTGRSGEIRVFMKEYNGRKRDCVALSSTLITNITNIGSEYDGQPIQGNIFDLLKKQQS